jgi:hypothetical protein
MKCQVNVETWAMVMLRFQPGYYLARPRRPLRKFGAEADVRALSQLPVPPAQLCQQPIHDTPLHI